MQPKMEERTNKLILIHTTTLRQDQGNVGSV